MHHHSLMMKSYSLLLLLILISIRASYSSVNLQEAIKNKWISAVITGIDYSTDSHYRSSYYGPCLQLKCKNLRSVPIGIAEIPGRFFMPTDTSIQRMVLTAGLDLNIPAGKEMTVPLYAMCTEANDHAPNQNQRFALGVMATSQLLSVVNFIADHNYQEETAQQAVWCITDNWSPYSIISSDTLISRQLLKLICDLKGLPYISDYIKSKTSPLLREVKGKFEYTISRSATVDLVIYNEAGQVVKDLIANESQSSGSYSYNYQLLLPINENKLLQQSLIIKFYLDGKLIAERKHVLNSH